MKAIVQDKYGSPEEVMKLQDIDKPVIKDDEVLIKVHSASLHIGDWVIARGVPYFMRMIFGLRKPKERILGQDIAGTVEAVGKKVKQFQLGDQVFGWCKGAFAEYACAGEDNLVLKPANISFEQAAAVGVSAFTALQAIRDQGEVQPGQQVLINGASGGVGTFAVQIAKALGAEVTGVCSTRNVSLVQSIGADHVIDYTKNNFTQGEQRYDFLLDLVGNHSLSDCRHVLTPKGTLLPSYGAHSSGRWIGAMGSVTKAFLLSLVIRQQRRPFVATQNKEDLATLREFLEADKVTPVTDRSYSLSETPAALAYLGEGHARGKVVITVVTSSKT